MMTLVKQPNESILYDMDFTGLGRIGIDTIQRINAINVTPAGLNIVSQVHDSASLVQFRVSSGLDGVIYKVDVIVTTTGGDILEGNGKIHVKNL